MLTFYSENYDPRIYDKSENARKTIREDVLRERQKNVSTKSIIIGEQIVARKLRVCRDTKSKDEKRNTLQKKDLETKYEGVDYSDLSARQLNDEEVSYKPTQNPDVRKSGELNKILEDVLHQENEPKTFDKFKNSSEMNDAIHEKRNGENLLKL